MALPYVDLHVHSTMSFGDGLHYPKDMIERAQALGRQALALTDHGNVSMHASFEREAKKLGIKPIYGVEAYVVRDAKEAREQKQRGRGHMTILANNQKGYQNLLAAVSQSWRNFYYMPLMDNDTLAQFSEGWQVLSGCLSSPLSKAILEERYADAEGIATRFRDVLGFNFSLEAQLFDHEGVRACNRAVVELGKRLKIPVVVTNDVHQLTAEHRSLRQFLHCIRDNRKWNQPASNEYQELTEYQLSDDEIWIHGGLAGLERPDLERAIHNTGVIAATAETYDLPKSGFLRFPLAEGETAVEALLNLIKQGFARRGLPLEGAYFDRAAYEFGIIESKGFIDYFLVVADMVMWAKDRGIVVGPARGSAGGSLVAYLLGITEIDPLQYGLMFERFIDVDRIDFPDIDIDFQRSRRFEIVQYLEDMYGRDRVGLIGNFMQWRGKSSLDAVGRVYSIPQRDINVVKAELDKYEADEDESDFNDIQIALEHSPVAREMMQRYPVLEMAGKLEGQMRTLSTHACGVLLSDRPLTEVCAVYHKPDGDAVASVNMGGAEYLGLLKVDVLGMKTFDVLGDCLEAAGMTPNDLYQLTTDDEETFRGFNEQDVLGTFQFEGHAMRRVLSQMPQVTSIIELSHIGALARPGPLDSGITDAFLRARNGMIPVPSMHPVIDERLAWTFGQVIYQEQITLLAMVVGKMSGGRADSLRKAISKKYGADVIEGMRSEFVTGAVENGMPLEAANDIFTKLLDFGRYCFNLSHSVAYALVSYWTMYFKRHYPTAFYAALLRHEEDQDSLKEYLREWNARGGRILPPHINRSKQSWSVEGPGLIRAGFDALSGIGEETAKLLVAGQPWEGLEDLQTRKFHRPTKVNPARMAAVGNKRIYEILDRAGVFNDDDDADFMGFREFRRIIDSTDVPYRIGKIGQNDTGEDFLIAGTISDVQKRSKREQAQRYHETLDYQNPELDEYVSFVLTDDTGTIPVTLGRYHYPRYRKLIEGAGPSDVLTVMGSKSTFTGRRIMAQDIRLVFVKQGDQYIHVDDLRVDE
jgi:DNA polymerase-3 subunit alpha